MHSSSRLSEVNYFLASDDESILVTHLRLLSLFSCGPEKYGFFLPARTMVFYSLGSR